LIESVDIEYYVMIQSKLLELKLINLLSSSLGHGVVPLAWSVERGIDGVGVDHLSSVELPYWVDVVSDLIGVVGTCWGQ
jgi:hypothetical protein